MGQIFCHCGAPERHDFFRKHYVLFADRGLSTTELHIDRQDQLWIARRRLDNNRIVRRYRCRLLEFADEVWIVYGELHDMLTIKFRETDEANYIVEFNAYSPQRTWMIQKRHPPRSGNDPPHNLHRLFRIIFLNTHPAKTEGSSVSPPV